MTSSLLLFTQITLLVVLLSLARADLDPKPDILNLYDSIDEIEMEMVAGGRRSLFWQRMRYYISYEALAANRVPCPPRSGRSYYTHDCWRARGPVHPYTRGCSAITRCRR
ncbi:protein RALF-like 34 [Bidens hawaiensis]|uniref:protein RALF-like 34 n=1 Tax=Bidens hawaiensis TaxID=980011 RepID=UPI0040492C19